MRHPLSQNALSLFLLGTLLLLSSCEKEESSAPKHQIARIHDAWYSNCNGKLEGVEEHWMGKVTRIHFPGRGIP